MDVSKTYKNLPSKTKNILKLAIILALTVALPLFIWSIINLNFNQNKKAASGEPLNISADEPILGFPEAPITIAAYEDFQCPSCKLFVDTTMSTILANYPTQVKFVFKDFPLLHLHPLAERASLAGQCAFKQNKFWEMHDLIYANQSSLSENDLISNFPNQLGLDISMFNACYLNKETLPEVQDDMTEGNFKNVIGTPTFFIGLSSNFNGGIKVEGALPFESFKTIIDQLLGQVSPTDNPNCIVKPACIDGVVDPITGDIRYCDPKPGTIYCNSTSTTSAKPTATATPTATSATGGFVEGEPNSCGGTCGSNYNCKANLYCYKGYCRNPICSEDTNCDCLSTTATPTISATPKPSNTILTGSSKPKSTSTPQSNNKGSAVPAFTYSEVADELSRDNNLNMEREKDTDQENENVFFSSYAIYIYAGLILLAIIVIYIAIKNYKQKSETHILPPTNI